MEFVTWQKILKQDKSDLISRYTTILKEKESDELLLKYIEVFLEIIEKGEDVQKLKNFIDEICRIPLYKRLKISHIQEGFLDFREVLDFQLKNKYSKNDKEREIILKEIDIILYPLIFKVADFYLESREFTILKQKTVLDRKIPELSMLLSISSAMNEMLDLDKLLQLIADEVLSLVNYYSFSIMLLNKEGELELKTIAGYRKNVPSRIKFKMGEGVAGWVAQNKKSLYIPDITVDKRFIEPYGEVKCIFSIPLFSRQQFIGVLNIDNTKIDAFSKEKRDVLKLLSFHAAIAITNARLHEETKEKSRIDPLTQVYNNTYFEKFFEQEIKKERTGEIPFSLFILNIDNFYKISSDLGYNKTDEILKEIGILLKKNLRKIDCIARIGKDEFGIILIGVNINEVEREGIKIKKLVEEHVWKLKEIKLTCCIGCTVYPVCGKEKEGLIAQARSAMVFAKKNGKSKVCVYLPQNR